MEHYQLHVKHSYLNLYNEPASRTIIVDKHGTKRDCIEALHDSFDELQEDLAKDGTETMKFISIVKVIKESL